MEAHPMFRSQTALFLLLTGCLVSCNSTLLDRGLGEGVIEYELSFPDQDPDGLMAGMLPERSTLSFRKHQQSAELSAGMGIFRTTMVIDNSVESLDYHMSLMSKKLVAHLAPADLELFNPSKQQPTILYTSELDTIAGYPCRKAVAVFDAMDRAECEIWYTDRIHMANPNWFGPFAEIPGVLLRYDVIQYGLRMRLNAIAVTPAEVDGAKFTRKPDFQEVSAEVLYDELAEILETFTM